MKVRYTQIPLESVTVIERETPPYAHIKCIHATITQSGGNYQFFPIAALYSFLLLVQYQKLFVEKKIHPYHRFNENKLII